jgi:tetratricopeptide (TPR) repeat protein
MPSLKQALDLHRAGDLPAAERAYRAVLQSQPRQPDALSLLGVVLEAQGKAAEAVGFIRKAVALDPKAALFRLHLGNALLAAGQPVEAAVELRAATRMQPSLAEAHYNLGNALRQNADHAGATAAFCACLALLPDYHPARNNLALVLAAQGDYAAAMTELRQVLHAEPHNLSAQINLANIADAAGDYPLALQEAEQAVALQPQHPDALFAQGLALNRVQRDAEAVVVYRRLLALAPAQHRAWDNLGQSLQALGDTPAAAAAYRQALMLAPDDAETNYHWALLLLLQGELAAGFRAYDWRWQAVAGLSRLPLAAPVWDGRDPAGKTILVADEQGFGDNLMFCRYLPLLRQRGARVIYACSPALLPLLQAWDGADQIVPVTDAAKMVCDVHCSMLDLPHLLGTTAQNIPAAVSYLAAPAGTVPDRISNERGLRVGLVWAGNPKHKHDARRSIAFDRFVALGGVPGVRYYNLMRPSDLRGDEAARFAAHDIIDLGAQIGDFAATARFIAALDLVIAVDTAVVHLAGALGQKVWVLLPFAPDWRWQLGRDDSPWYPSAKLYRQEQPGDWEAALARVREDLAALVAS